MTDGAAYRHHVVEEDVDDDDDQYKNGLKPFLWGPYFWYVLHRFAYCCDTIGEDESDGPPAGDDSVMSRPLIVFFFRAMADLLPCVHCRTSCKLLLDGKTDRLLLLPVADPHDRASLSVREYVFLLHNAVNCKLNKQCVTYHDADRHWSTLLRADATDPATRDRRIWRWIEMLAFNFPADISPPERFAQQGKTYQTELKARVATYIQFFELLKYYLTTMQWGYAAEWCKQYARHPPTLHTFSSRLALLEWIYDMEARCGFRRADQGRRGFLKFMSWLHPMRSAQHQKPVSRYEQAHGQRSV